MTRIAIVSEKGGVGKTTIALNLALSFADAGRRVLLADMDPQGGVGFALGRADAEEIGLTDYLMNDARWEDALLQTKHPQLVLLPRGRLDPVDTPEYEAGIHAPGVLQRMLEEMEATTELTLLDCPSGLGLVPRACLLASQYALVPVPAEPMAVRALHRTLRVIENVQAQNAKLELLGILPTFVESTGSTSHAVMTELWTGFDSVFDTSIPRSDLILRASARGLPVAYLAGSPSAEERRFHVLASEISARLSAQESRNEEHGIFLERPLL